MPSVPADQAVRLDKALRAVGASSYFVAVRGPGTATSGPAADDRAAACFAKSLLVKDDRVPTEPIEKSGR